MSVAPGMWPAAHSSGWRTSSTNAPASRSRLASATETLAGRAVTGPAGALAAGAVVGVAAGEQAATRAAAARTAAASGRLAMEAAHQATPGSGSKVGCAASVSE